MPGVWGCQPPVPPGAPPLTSAAVAGEQEAAQRQGSQPSAAHGRPHRARTPTAARSRGAGARRLTSRARGGAAPRGAPRPPPPIPEGGLLRRGKAAGWEQVAVEHARLPSCRDADAGASGRPPWQMRAAEPARATQGARFSFSGQKKRKAGIPPGSLGGPNRASAGAPSGWGKSRGPPPPKISSPGSRCDLTSLGSFAASCLTEWASNQT